MGPGDPRGLHEVVPDDQVRVWQELSARFPRASYSVRDGWFHGSLREEDTVLRASSLQRLIGALLERG